MAAQTPNIGLPLKFFGIEAIRQSVRRAFGIVDTEIQEIKDRLDALEGGLDDSNSQFIDNP